MGLPSPQEQAKMIKEEAKKVFEQGEEATKAWLKDSYKVYQKLNTKWRQDDTNVVL
jgi:hypothetical protein